VEDAAPLREGLVGGEEHGPSVEVAAVLDLEEDIGSLRTVGEVADLVNDEDVGMGVGGDGLGERTDRATPPVGPENSCVICKVASLLELWYRPRRG